MSRSQAVARGETGAPARSGLPPLVRRAGSALSGYTGVGSVLVALVVYLSITQDRFLTVGNLVNILETGSVTLIVAIGLTFVLLTGGFDLSVGGMLALSGIGLALLVGAGVPAALAILLVIAGSTALGLATNGLLIARVGLSFFVVTLGTASLFRGVAYVVTGGTSIGLYEEQFLRTVGSGRVAGVPWSVIIALAVLALAIVVTRSTGYGRMLYAVGGNPEAARLAGIDVVAVRASVYAIAAGLAGLGSVIEAGRLATAAPTVATGLELSAGAAVLLGGTSFLGGAGTMVGTLLGAFFLGVLQNGLTLLQVSNFWQGVVSGAVLILAVLLDRFRRKASVGP
jgi:ribose transport system permease protein